MIPWGGEGRKLNSMSQSPDAYEIVFLHETSIALLDGGRHENNIIGAFQAGAIG